MTDLADVLAEAGSVVGGTAALGAAVFYVGAYPARRLGLATDPLKAAELGAAVGGALGVLALAVRPLSALR